MNIVLVFQHVVSSAHQSPSLILTKNLSLMKTKQPFVFFWLQISKDLLKHPIAVAVYILLTAVLT